jgi:hypothetical protein
MVIELPHCSWYSSDHSYFYPCNVNHVMNSIKYKSWSRKYWIILHTLFTNEQNMLKYFNIHISNMICQTILGHFFKLKHSSTSVAYEVGYDELFLLLGSSIFFLFYEVKWKIFIELIYLWQSAKHDSAYPAPYGSQMFTLFHDILPH